MSLVNKKKMNYEETLHYLYTSIPVFQHVGTSAYKPGLETSRALDNYLGNPHRAYQTLHVGGTNGKGSTSHLLAAILVSNKVVNVAIVLLCAYFFSDVVQWEGAYVVEFILLTLLLTFLLLLFGEIMPRIYSAQNSLKFCRIVVAPVCFLHTICRVSSCLYYSAKRGGFQLLKFRLRPHMMVIGPETF